MFAIRGCKGRGDEVIEFLEMLGGVWMDGKVDGEDDKKIYFINSKGEISETKENHFRAIRFRHKFELDEILEESKFRLGDMVYTFGLDYPIRIDKLVARENGVWYMTSNRKANGYADNFSYEPL